jgi:ABC-type nitrate/sulfonate/bicarbonate transport system permease component
VLILVAWELACWLLAVDPLTLPAPSRIGSALWAPARRSVTATTLGETVLGFGLSVFAVTVARHGPDPLVRRAVYLLLIVADRADRGGRPAVHPMVRDRPLPKVLVVVLVTFFPIAVALLDGLAATPAVRQPCSRRWRDAPRPAVKLRRRAPRRRCYGPWSR